MSSSAVDRDKADFIRRLDDSRSVTQKALKDIDPQLIIYPVSGWRVKDLIAHLTAWEAGVVTSLQAYTDGSEYRIPDFPGDDAYNEALFQRYRNHSAEQLYRDWGTTRAAFKAAIQAVLPERFNGQVMCPWGLYSGIPGIVNDMIGHEAEHLRDILTVIG